MGFLAPIGAAIGGALGGAGIGSVLAKGGLAIGSSLLGSKLGGGSGGVPGGTNELIGRQKTAMDRILGMSTSMQPQAQGLLNQASNAYSPVIDYYGGLLSGDRGRTMSTQAPDINRINQSYDNTLQTQSALTPRGGGRASLLSEAPYARQRDITTLLQQSRPQAAQGLLQAGQAVGQQGGSLLNQIMSSLSGVSAGNQGLLNYDLQSRAEQSRKNQQLGEQIYGILGPLLGKLGNKGKDINL